MDDEPTITLTESQIDEMIARAVRRTLLEIGIDVSAPSEIRKTQDDMSFLRGWRESTEEVRRHGLRAAVTVIVAGACGLVWAAIHVPWGAR
jgi:hypothetical protein